MVTFFGVVNNQGYVDFQTFEDIMSTYGQCLELHSKSLLLKTSHSWAIGNEDIKLGLI